MTHDGYSVLDRFKNPTLSLCLSLTVQFLILFHYSILLLFHWCLLETPPT